VSKKAKRKSMFESEFRQRIKKLSYVRLVDKMGKYKLIILGSLVFATLLAIVVQYSPRSIMVSVGMLAGAILCMANYSVFNNFKDPVFHRAKKYFAAFALAFVLSFLSGLVINSSKAHRSKAMARPVVEAIRKYEKEFRAFPDSLEVLVPKYLGAVPTTAMGWTGYELLYEVPEPNRFRLVIPYGGGGFDWVYDSDRNKWIEGK